MANDFTIARSGERYLIEVREGRQLTDIYDCDRKALPWIVKRLLRRGAVVSA